MYPPQLVRHSWCSQLLGTIWIDWLRNRKIGHVVMFGFVCFLWRAKWCLAGSWNPSRNAGGERFSGGLGSRGGTSLRCDGRLRGGCRSCGEGGSADRSGGVPVQPPGWVPRGWRRLVEAPRAPRPAIGSRWWPASGGFGGMPRPCRECGGTVSAAESGHQTSMRCECSVLRRARVLSGETGERRGIPPPRSGRATTGWPRPATGGIPPRGLVWNALGRSAAPSSPHGRCPSRRRPSNLSQSGPLGPGHPTPGAEAASELPLSSPVLPLPGGVPGSRGG
ncbi:hypothetical protein ABH917_001842 [Thermobifida halotolerans]